MKASQKTGEDRMTSYRAVFVNLQKAAPQIILTPDHGRYRGYDVKNYRLKSGGSHSFSASTCGGAPVVIKINRWRQLARKTNNARIDVY